MGFLAFYLAGKLHLFDERGHAGKAWLSLTPFLAASLVAISRTMDYRHHWQDVTVGTIVGIVFSFFAYRQYYPSLSSPLSHRPYSPRIARADGDHAVLPTHTANSSISVPAGNTYQGGNPGIGLGNTAYAGGGTQHAQSQDPYLEGTVPRPGLGSLEEVWNDGEEDAPRTGNENPGGRNTLYPGYHAAPPQAVPSAVQGV
jgi:diacylglycerol diphosphate phosphatase/phosphatidate phosphatase